MLVASGEARRRPSIHRPHETAAGKQTNHTLNISIDLKASHFNSCELSNKMVQVFFIKIVSAKKQDPNLLHFHIQHFCSETF